MRRSDKPAPLPAHGPLQSVHEVSPGTALHRVHLRFWKRKRGKKNRASSRSGYQRIPGGLGRLSDAVVAPRSGNKLTQKDGADGGVQFIAPAGPRQSPLSQGPRPIFVKTLYTLSVRAQTHLSKFPETSLNKGKERCNQS